MTTKAKKTATKQPDATKGERVLDVEKVTPKKSTQRPTKESLKAPPKEVAASPATLAGISFHDQDTAAKDPDFLGRVAAAAFSAAVFMYKQPANTDPLSQTRRAALIRQAINNPELVAEQMARLVVSQQTTAVSFISDDAINTVLTTPGLFDGLAGQIFSTITTP